MTDNVRSISPRRRRQPSPARSHEEIYDLVAKATENAADARSRADMSHLVGQRVEKKLDDLIKAVGSESEDDRGVRIGTGVVGRLMRLETNVGKRFALYDGWTKLVIGFSACAAVLVPVVWWLVSDKLSIVLK